jgi:spermidine synthase
MEFEEINNKYNTEFTNKLLENKHIFYEIYEACGNKFWKGCGSYLFDGQTYKYCNLMYEKQELLFNIVKNVKDVLEIGTYMGHSLLIMLLSNPNLQITCVDIDDKYTLSAINVLNKYFNNAITFIHSDSLSAFKKIKKKFDFFHIDGHHNDYITNEFYSIQQLNNRSDNILRVLFDDQISLEKLQNDIYIKYNIINKIIPNCSWNNVYFEIQM